MPAPSISNARDSADATTASAITAPHDTAEAPLSGLKNSSRALTIGPDRAFKAAFDTRTLLEILERALRRQ
jgi:hypothetical protein